MRIVIDTSVLSKYSISESDFIILLIGYLKISKEDFNTSLEKYIKQRFIGENYLTKSILLSNNAKDLVAEIITESEANRISDIDFDKLAKRLQEIYPKGNKPGTTYEWRGTTREIAQKLRALVVYHHFIFSEEEAVKAIKEYIEFFKGDTKYMQLLKYFILRTVDGDIDSTFMSIIENNREWQQK